MRRHFEGGDVTLEVAPDMLRKELTMIASWTFSTAIHADRARFIADRKIEVVLEGAFPREPDHGGGQRNKANAAFCVRPKRR